MLPLSGGYKLANGTVSGVGRGGTSRLDGGHLEDSWQRHRTDMSTEQQQVIATEVDPVRVSYWGEEEELSQLRVEKLVVSSAEASGGASSMPGIVRWRLSDARLEYWRIGEV